MTTVDPSQPPSSAGSAGPSGNPQVHNTVNVDEAKVLLNNAGTATTHVYLGSAADDGRRTLDALVEDLPALPSNIRPFRDPRHETMRDALEQQRLLLLSSYQESAAYAAAYTLVQDQHFGRQAQKAFFPRRGRDRDRSDLDLFAVADEQFLGEAAQVLLVDIDGHCPLLDSALSDLGPMTLAMIGDKLKRHGSYVIIVVNEDLVAHRTTKPRMPYYSVSHLRYLLDRTGRAEDLERRVIQAVAFAAGSMEMRELYQRLSDRLEKGLHTLEEFVAELEHAQSLPPADRQNQIQPVTPEEVFPEDSEAHRAASFIATYFPDVRQSDFDRLVITLLADQATTVERSRQVVARDGTVTLVREQVQERWSERWERSADRVFRECRLHTVASPGGAWLVDFSEPHLRRELRTYFERHHAWYLKRQCKTLQESGVIFALDLSAAAVEALVRLFVERAVVDPVGFGSVWLLDLVQGLRLQLHGKPPHDSQEEILAWVLEQLSLEAQLRSHFYGRLALLIREMLDREPLRRMVRDFFEFLIAARQHDALLGVVLDLARRLRFAPHFDPLVWMRRLLDQGSAAVRERTEVRLITLARDSGPRIYEFLAVIRTWLPDVSRAPERFSTSNRVALEFPFRYCIAAAASLSEDSFGQWPSHHPLFYALPADTADARREIGLLIEWILDPRGAALRDGDEPNSALTTEARQIAYAADLIEHWACVLEGSMNNGRPEGRALFHVIVEEINRRLDASCRLLLQRTWRRRQDSYVAQAAVTQDPQRTLLIKRQVRLEHVRRRFAQESQPKETVP